MHSTRLMISAVIVALTAVTTLYLAIGRNPLATDVANPERTRTPETTRLENAVALEAGPRVPAIAEQPDPATRAAPTPPESAPAAREVLGDSNSWPAEYAKRSLAELTADAERLSEEFKKDIDAEFEKRFQDGRYESYAQGSQPKQQSTWGILRGRGDANTIKYVNLDPRIEPELFLKESKAGWLRGEVARRQR